MSNRNLAAGLFRAWGVIWSIYVLIGVPQFLNTLLRNPYGADQGAIRQFAVSSHAISLGCEIVIAIFLIRKAGWLAEVVFPVEQQATFSFSAEDFQAALFSAVGLYFFLDGVRHLVGSGVQLLTRPQGNDQNAFSYLWQRQAEQLAIGLGGAVAGGLVFLGRGRLVNPWKAVKGIYRKLFGLQESAGE